ncbi:hypothetical protein QJS66_07640 [Kocuria rhizophila]|nr:hypothetical protein QJS66_07640 [Kocuria rhizophila]
MRVAREELALVTRSACRTGMRERRTGQDAHAAAREPGVPRVPPLDRRGLRSLGYVVRAHCSTPTRPGAERVRQGGARAPGPGGAVPVGGVPDGAAARAWASERTLRVLNEVRPTGGRDQGGPAGRPRVGGPARPRRDPSILALRRPLPQPHSLDSSARWAPC